MSWRASAYIKALRVCPNSEPLTRSEKLVAYAVADSHQDRGHSHTFPSVEVLAEDSLMTKRECQRVLASLERKGVIVRVRPPVQFRGVTTFYRFPQLDDSAVRVTPEPPLPKQKGDTQAALNSSDPIPRRVTEGCRKGDISRTVYKEEQEQELNTLCTEMKPPISDAEEFSLRAEAGEQKPKRKSRVKPEVDDRHAPLMRFIEEIYGRHNRSRPGGLAMPLPDNHGHRARVLKNFLNGCPWTPEEINQCITNRFASANVSVSEMPSTWIPNLARYRAGPLEFGAPKANSNNGQPAEPKYNDPNAQLAALGIPARRAM